MTTTYLDIGAVRVQSYLGRWPSLAGRRAGSALLQQHLSADSPGLQHQLQGRARKNTDAGTVDSVLSVTVEDGVNPEVLARDLLAFLRRALPAAELTAVWASAPDYVAAFPLMQQKVRSGHAVESVPVDSGFPLLKRCDLCRIDAAVTTVRLPEGEASACADCALRADAPRESPAELRLRSESGRATASTFEALSALGADRKKNHVAHVLADGNGFGQFFAALARSGLPKDAVSAALHDAAFEALLRAESMLALDQPPLSRVLPHLVGGDDLFVTVPASDGWAFVRTYLDEFDRLVAEAVRAAGPSLPIPTASAAIVIAHRAWPVNSAVDLAEALLRRAKNHGGGVRSTVAWLEVTRRGADPDAGFMPIGLDELEEWYPHLGPLAELAPSSRHRLESLLADDTVGHLDARRSATRMGIDRIAYPPVASWRLAAALDISRWWRP